MDTELKKHAEKIRFGLVGGANTAIDFIIFLGLTFLGLDKIVSNYISTTVAFLFSFLMNKNYTFKARGTNTKKEFALFTVVTLSALWVVQPIVIVASSSMLDGMINSQQLNLTLSKIVATVVSLIWNYVFYSRLVFKKDKK